MPTEHASFEAALGSAEGKKNLLLGNGLSMAFDAGIFAYAKLFDAAQIERDHAQLATIFRALNTRDFESVASALSLSRRVAEAFGDAELARTLGMNLEILRDALIQAVRGNHPATRDCIGDAQAVSFQDFVSRFLLSDGCIFSLNYDALMYWAILRNLPNSPIRGRFSDGFGQPLNNYVSFMGSAGENINLLYPHGALFLFERQGEVYKPRTGQIGGSLIDLITENMNRNDYPLFVSEGTSVEKKEAIRKNYYLNFCFEHLSKMEDNFFIFGHSLDLSSDGHIFDKIAENRSITNIYASYFNDVDATKANLLQIRSRSGRRANQLNLHVYPAQSVRCW